MFTPSASLSESYHALVHPSVDQQPATNPAVKHPISPFLNKVAPPSFPRSEKKGRGYFINKWTDIAENRPGVHLTAHLSDFTLSEAQFHLYLLSEDIFAHKSLGLTFGVYQRLGVSKLYKSCRALHKKLYPEDGETLVEREDRPRAAVTLCCMLSITGHTARARGPVFKNKFIYIIALWRTAIDDMAKRFSKSIPNFTVPPSQF